MQTFVTIWTVFLSLGLIWGVQGYFRYTAQTRRNDADWERRRRLAQRSGQ